MEKARPVVRFKDVPSENRMPINRKPQPKRSNFAISNKQPLGLNTKARYEQFLLANKNRPKTANESFENKQNFSVEPHSKEQVLEYVSKHKPLEYSKHKPVEYQVYTVSGSSLPKQSQVRFSGEQRCDCASGEILEDSGDDGKTNVGGCSASCLGQQVVFQQPSTSKQKWKESKPKSQIPSLERVPCIPDTCGRFLVRDPYGMMAPSPQFYKPFSKSREPGYVEVTRVITSRPITSPAGVAGNASGFAQPRSPDLQYQRSRPVPDPPRTPRPSNGFDPYTTTYRAAFSPLRSSTPVRTPQPEPGYREPYSTVWYDQDQPTYEQRMRTCPAYVRAQQPTYMVPTQPYSPPPPPQLRSYVMPGYQNEFVSYSEATVQTGSLGLDQTVSIDSRLTEKLSALEEEERKQLEDNLRIYHDARRKLIMDTTKMTASDNTLDDYIVGGLNRADKPDERTP